MRASKGQNTWEVNGKSFQKRFSYFDFEERISWSDLCLGSLDFNLIGPELRDVKCLKIYEGFIKLWITKKDNLCGNQEKREGVIMTGKGGEMEEEMAS